MERQNRYEVKRRGEQRIMNEGIARTELIPSVKASPISTHTFSILIFSALPRYVRVNSLLVTMREAHEYLQGNDYSLEFGMTSFLDANTNKKYYIDEDVPFLLVFHPKTKLHDDEWVTTGRFILQDKSSCLVAPLLAPHPGSTVLDMCAAPGLKTQHLACQLHGYGEIIAVDNSKQRFEMLVNLITKFQLTNVTCMNMDALKLDAETKRKVHYILLDAPCSGSGVVKNLDFKKKKNQIQSFHNLQAALLRSALTEYPSARRVIYSTCSINEQENEHVIDEFIQPPSGWILTNLSGFYKKVQSGRENCKSGEYCLRLNSEKNRTNGFFIAMFERPNPPSTYTEAHQ